MFHVKQLLLITERPLATGEGGRADSGGGSGLVEGFLVGGGLGPAVPGLQTGEAKRRTGFASDPGHEVVLDATSGWPCDGGASRREGEAGGGRALASPAVGGSPPIGGLPVRRTRVAEGLGW